MTNSTHHRRSCGLAVVFALASAAPVFANTSLPGSEPGDVYGHIDIPEIGFGGARPGPFDPFTQGLNPADEFPMRLPESFVLPPEPVLIQPPNLTPTGENRITLFPPSAGPASSVGAAPLLDFDFGPRGAGSFSAPVSAVPTPGALTLLLIGAGLGAARRRR